MNARLGIDVGSTTVKLVLVCEETGEVLHSRYERHHARPAETLDRLLAEAARLHPGVVFRAAVCGSGGKPVADALSIPFIQEVVANSAAVCALYPQARTAVELGGQDAKVVFFAEDPDTGELSATDMRMNGSCAGGTGAFIDEIASLLDVRTEDFESLAARGANVYDISGRCGVFAKTDIQPLLIAGTAREDIALSTFHAIARQTIGGLSQGLELKPPIVFEGGPLTFNPTLERVFAERLGLADEEILTPEHPETIVAYGTAIAIERLFPGEGEPLTFDELRRRLSNRPAEAAAKTAAVPLFAGEDARRAFEKRHAAELRAPAAPAPVDGVLRVYMGIDSGSTTSKVVLMDEDEELVDSFYGNNRGEPLAVVRDGILGLYRKYDELGIRLEVLGLGTTGYGELLFAKAFGADFHVVETVAHSQGCIRFVPDATFLLDIGGQDMKAIWLDDGIITNMMLNEACSSGCGSFLENFAATLGIAVEDIAETAFSSSRPATLGSRCTVFMNSTIINEQREGRTPEDIMAGLCRSIIENVFTKVVRVSSPDALGPRVVVQGGTFRNKAVLRAIEEYLGRDVTLAPYPGEMGAFGAALMAKRHIEEHGYAGGHAAGAAGQIEGSLPEGAAAEDGSSYIGRKAVESFAYTTHTGVSCPLCANHCNLTVTTFSSGDAWVAGNRCERGARQAVEEARRAARPQAAQRTSDGAAAPPCGLDAQDDLLADGSDAAGSHAAPDMFRERERLVLQEYPFTPAAPPKDVTVGIPRVLEFWDSMPFWTTFFKALGYRVKISGGSGSAMYQRGLPFVASDTICFPAKLVHGHILDLAHKQVDRIFMPYVMHMPPEGVDKQSPYVCAVVQGYPMVVRNSQSPEERYGIPFDTPVFHWFQDGDREKQIVAYARAELGATEKQAKRAFEQGSAALAQFRDALRTRADEIIDAAQRSGGYAVVLAGRPYHTDPCISHGISQIFAKKGIPVLTVDALPGLDEVDLKNTRIEITNDFHTRMLAGAAIAARNPALEYVQLVSFGCGHDAVLSDEIVRIMTTSGDKPPLILKVDESEASGSLGIRIQSFIETVAIRRKRRGKARALPIPDPSPVKYYEKDKKIRTILIPNISAEVSTILCGIFEKEGLLVKSVPVGDSRQIALGKKYVHNDICFPCQMVIGELIGELQAGDYDQDDVAVGMVKFQCDCRMSHYAGLLRKGLDAAGFERVPIVTTDAGDTKGMHPGVSLLGASAVVEAVWCFMMLDILTDLCRKTRPYEVHPGETDRVYQSCVTAIADAIRGGVGSARKAFGKCVDDMARIPWDRGVLKPQVFVTGELLVTYHPGSNFHIERYLEDNGMEAVFPRVTDQLRKDFLASMAEIRDYHADIPPYPFVVSYLFDSIQKKLERIAARHPLYEKALRPKQLYEGVRDIIPETLSCGEGWLMAAEIDHYAKQGVGCFVILQPFGCLPNHICGRGVVKKLKERHPGISILPLDLDPDTSFANVENRLQMLLFNNQRNAEEDEAS